MHTLAEGSQLANVLTNKYSLAIFTAIVTGLVGFFFANRLEARKRRRKQLSWDMLVDARLVQIKSDLHQAEGGLRKQIAVSYGGNPVERLTNIAFRVTNTGQEVVKNQFIRFTFPDGARILEAYPDPTPEPELGVTDVTEPDHLARGRRFQLAHLEAGQSVGFRFLSDGGDWGNWKGIHPHNDEGNVGFHERDVARVKADQEHVRPFLVLVTLLLLVQLVLEPALFAAEAVQLIRFATTLLLVGLLLPHLLPVARLIERVAARYSERQGNITHQTLSGDVDGNVVQARSISGDVYFNGQRKKVD